MADLKPFTPSIDWGNELAASLRWIATTAAISAVCLFAVLALVVRFTRSGRQFWYVTGDYFSGRRSLRIWLRLGALMVSVITAVRLSVLFSYQGNDLSTAVQIAVQGAATDNIAVKNSGVHGFWISLLIFAILAALLVTRMLLDQLMTQRFMLAWRAWLTERLIGNWLDGRAYYLNRFTEETIDNPGQRLESDIDVFTALSGAQQNTPSQTSNGTLLFGGVASVVSVTSFTSILWRLSGDVSIFGIVLPKAMFWTLFLYVGFATVFATHLGRPLTALSFNNTKFNAAFRYSLVRLRDGAETIAFDRGETFERQQLRKRFEPVISNYKRFVNRTLILTGWNQAVNHVIIPLPWILQAPRLFAGQIKFGDVTQSVSVFGSIQDALSWFRNSFARFAGYQAAILRLYEVVNAADRSNRLTRLTVEESGSGTVEFNAVEVRTPAGAPLITDLDLRLEAGESMVVSGSSGAGKTALLRSLAQLWPFASGAMRAPAGAHEMMFMSEQPHIPSGDLRTVVSYPRQPGEIDDEGLRRALLAVALPDCADRLDEEAEWDKLLSPSEQQRIAFARLLLTKPKAVFLDGATSALDEPLEFMIYSLARRELPDSVLVSATNRSSLNRHHQRNLQLLGGGEWKIERLEHG
jgi:putative ATP-binding cassette transporter